MSDDDKSVADMIEKSQHRGAAPPESMTLIAAVDTPPPPGTWILEIPFTDADVIPDPDEDDLAQEGNGEN